MPRKKQLAHSESHNAFWVNNGPVCYSLLDLRNALEAMSDEQFAYHASKEKNDFVLWISEVLKEKECADSLKRIRTRKSALKKVSECLKGYNV